MKFLLAAVSVAVVVVTALANDPHQVNERSLAAVSQVPEFTDDDYQIVPDGRKIHYFTENYKQLENQLEISSPINEDQQMMDRYIIVDGVVVEQNHTEIDYQDDDMEMLLGRSRWCRRRHNGRCLNPRKHSCGRGYQWSPMGKPYCIGKRRRCCYPVKTTKASTTTVAPTTTTTVKTTKASTTTVAPTTTTTGCPADYFQVSGSQQCFRYYSDTPRSWEDAQSKCNEEGAVLAMTDNNPIQLRNYISTNYPSTRNSWLGARGTGSSVKWIQDGTAIETGDPMWNSGEPASKTTTNYCLMYRSWRGAITGHPSSTYLMHSCTGEYNTVCEWIRK